MPGACTQPERTVAPGSRRALLHGGAALVVPAALLLTALSLRVGDMQLACLVLMPIATMVHACIALLAARASSRARATEPELAGRGLTGAGRALAVLALLTLSVQGYWLFLVYSLWSLKH